MDNVKAKIRGARVLWRQQTLSVLGAFEGKQLRTVAVVEQGLIQRAPIIGQQTLGNVRRIHIRILY